VPRTSDFTVPRRAHAESGPRLNHRLRRWLAAELRGWRAPLRASAQACRADRYRKHFTARAHASLLLFHGLSGSPSLRQSYATFGTCATLLAESGLGAAAAEAGDGGTLGVSFSQFADSNTSRPADFLAGLVPLLVERVRHLGRRPTSALPPDLHLLDSTFLGLSLKLSPWLPHGPKMAGVRVQVHYTPSLDAPEHVLVTDTRKNDCTGFDALLLDEPTRLAALRGQTLVMDLGYYSHRRFARLFTAGVHLVSRLKEDAAVRVDADLPLQSPLPVLSPGPITVQREQRVTVGSPNNRAGAVLPHLRLITALVQPSSQAARQGAQPMVYRLVTDRWDLAPTEVVQIYLWRWQIELFFRWMKRFVHLPRVLGHSRNAVELTVWLAIIVHLLLVLAAHALGLPRRSPTLLRHLLFALVLLSPADAHKLPPAWQQLALPLPLPREAPT
jgi:Transposase DDE domain